MSTEPPQDRSAVARETWTLMSDLVLDNDRRRQVSEALGMTFARTRAIRRLARRSMSMRELAAMLDIEPPNATVLVDDLEAQGLVRRRPHPTDRRAKIVEATRKGNALARKAEQILSTPPPGMAVLSDRDLLALRRVLQKAAAANEQVP
jgi:DNA-binding MarR family transcriptional regulator